MEQMAGDLIFIYRELREEELISCAELERLSRPHGFRLCFVVGDHALCCRPRTCATSGRISATGMSSSAGRPR